MIGPVPVDLVRAGLEGLVDEGGDFTPEEVVDG
jgi:hypothetical protein